MHAMNEIRKAIETIELEQSMCPENSKHYRELEAKRKKLMSLLTELFWNSDYKE